MTDLRQELEHALHTDYTFERELGGAGMSRVFVATEVRLGRKVVIKVLSPDLAAGISAERFQREIKLAASLQQANIVPVLATGDANGVPFYTMPFVDGESLRSRMATAATFTTTEIVRVLGDVARALQFAHDRGVVHRDIKPDNVLLSGGTAVVTDFGIAKALSVSWTDGAGAATITQFGTSIGTPAYMAPEQAAGDPDVDARADIYAFGCMAYELLIGRPPFAGRTPARVLAAHMGEPPQPLGELAPDLPAALSDLIMRCLEKDPEARPQSAAELTRTLDAITSGGQPAAPAILLHGPQAFRTALLIYAGGVLGVAVVAKLAMTLIGLPEWVLPGALIVMALGLPVILFTGYAQAVTRRALTVTPARTPGGSPLPRGTMATIALKASPHLSWRRATRGGIYALSAFVALIVAFMAMRALGVGPAASLLSAGRLKQRDPVIVSEFTVNRTDESVGRVVAEAVRTSLGESSSITVTSPASIAAALRRMQRPANSLVDEALARDVALREGIKGIVTGDVTGLGAGFVIALRIVSVDSQQVLASYATTVDGPKDLIDGVDRVARKLRGKIGESLKTVHDNPPLAQVSTASLDALKAYTTGTTANDVERNWAKAIGALRQAVAIDTGFAMAWRKLGVALNNARAPRSQVDSALTKAHQLHDRLTTHEAGLSEAYYYLLGPGRDRAKGMAIYQSMLDRGDSVGVLNNLGLGYSYERDWTRAAALFRASTIKEPNFALGYGNLITALSRAGKWSEVGPVRDSIRARFPANVAIETGTWAYHTGDTATLRHAIDSLSTSTNPNDRRWALGAKTSLALLHGRIAEGLRNQVTANGGVAAAGGGRSALSDSIQLMHAEVWWLGDANKAVRRLDEALGALPVTSLPEPDRPYTDAAKVYALAGKPDRARALLAQRASELRDTALLRATIPAVRDAEAEIALAEGRPREAVSLFRQSERVMEGQPSESASFLTAYANLGRAFDLANMPDSAIAYFRKFEQTPDVRRIGVDGYQLAGVYKRLGELYDAKGDTANAELYLGRFIDLWKNADPELQPKVADARRRLARLHAKSG